MQRKIDISIRRYTREDENAVFALMVREGADWKAYWDEDGKPKYQKALDSSVTYLIFENKIFCGFARCRPDDGFGIYVYDLLIDREYRGKEYGRLLLEQVYNDYPGEEAYVMSDADDYYAKLGYSKAGSIFEIHIK